MFPPSQVHFYGSLSKLVLFSSCKFDKFLVFSKNPCIQISVIIYNLLDVLVLFANSTFEIFEYLFLATCTLTSEYCLSKTRV